MVWRVGIKTLILAFYFTHGSCNVGAAGIFPPRSGS
jgi:hypothetical protein